MRRTGHGLKMLGVATAAALVVSAFAASAAQAGHTIEVGGVLLKAGESRTCQATADGTMTIDSEVLGTTLQKTATGIETTGCKVTQIGSGATAEATGSAEKISFTGLTVDLPTGCKTNSPLTTNPVKVKIVTAAGVAYATFSPASGTTFANVTLKECAAAETYPVKGSFCAEMPQVGVLAVQQTGKASEAADKACAGDTLTLGGKPATLRGGLILELTGADAGKSWGFTAT